MRGNREDWNALICSRCLLFFPLSALAMHPLRTPSDQEAQDHCQMMPFLAEEHDPKIGAILQKSSDRRFATERTKIMYGNPKSCVQMPNLHQWKKRKCCQHKSRVYASFLTRQAVCMFPFQSENHDPARLRQHPQT